MRSGEYDLRIILQRKSVQSSDSGAPQESWTDISTFRWARMRPLISTELSAPIPQIVAKERIGFRIRWESIFADLSPLDRIISPAEDAGLSPVPTRSIYDIVAVSEIGRQEVIDIQAYRRADVA